MTDILSCGISATDIFLHFMKIQVPMFSNAALFPSHLLLAARIKKCMTNRDLSRLNFQTREFHSQKQKEELLSIYLYDNYTKRRLLEFTIKKRLQKRRTITHKRKCGPFTQITEANFCQSS